MSITAWPKYERPREKLIQFGADSLSTTELLAILLGHGYKNKSAIDLARELLIKHDGLRKLVSIPFADIIKEVGFGPAKYCQLQAAIEISKRALKESLTRSSVITNTQTAKTFIHATLRDYTNEVVGCLFLDNQYRIIEFELISQGAINFAIIHPRNVIKRVLHHNAVAIIVAHNHPSGCTTPSEADIKTTHHLQKALALFDIQLLDHFIVGNGEVTSFSEEGLLTELA